MTSVQLSNITWRFLRVWRRDAIVYRRIWKVNFLVPLFEPAFYIISFGLGMSGLVEQVRYAGASYSYIEFMAPALVATAMMWNSFFETTYASFVRMYYQKTFDGILATPLSLEEIVLGEIFWAATKAVGAATIMLAVLTPLGFVAFPAGLAIIPLALLGGLAFAAAGMFFTGITPSIDMFSLPVFLFITPMFLFSGAFYPVHNLPVWAQAMTWLFPLFHLVELTRGLALGRMESVPVLNVLYLLAFTAVFTYLGMRSMRRRMIT